MESSADSDGLQASIKLYMLMWCGVFNEHSNASMGYTIYLFSRNAVIRVVREFRRFVNFLKRFLEGDSYGV